MAAWGMKYRHQIAVPTRAKQSSSNGSAQQSRNRKPELRALSSHAG
jgi:hypothetical protein